MTYREPAHGWWCNARTYPTRCRDCGAKVFYFSCDCGSKVFFDSLGWPWPIHDCTTSILEQVEISIQQEYAQRIAEREERRRRGWEIPIKACQPQQGEDVVEIGVVREIVDNIDVFRKFDLPPDSPIAIGMLGNLSNSTFTQVTLHVADLGSESTSSYTFLVEENTWCRLQAKHGDLLFFTLIGRAIPGRDAFWLCTEIDWSG